MCVCVCVGTWLCHTTVPLPRPSFHTINHMTHQRPVKALRADGAAETTEIPRARRFAPRTEIERGRGVRESKEAAVDGERREGRSLRAARAVGARAAAMGTVLRRVLGVLVMLSHARIA